MLVYPGRMMGPRRGGGGASYLVNGLSPETVADFGHVKSNDEFFRVGGSTADFATMFTFARLSAGTFIGSDGLLQTASSGTARRDAFTGAARRGLFIESASATNFCLFSEDFGSWGTLGGNLSRATGQTDPAGGSTAARLTCTSSGSTTGNYLRRAASGSGYSNAVNSFWVRRVSGSGAVRLLEPNNGTAGTDIGPSLTSEWQRFSQYGASTGTVFIGVGVEVSGDAVDIAFAQAEPDAGDVPPTSYIATDASTATRAAETLVIAAADMAASTTAMWFQMQGVLTYQDNASATEATFYDWTVDANNNLSATLSTASTDTGKFVGTQEAAATVDTANGASELTPGENVAFNFAIRNTSGAIQVANGGSAGTENSTPVALADLSSADFDLVTGFNGYISLFRQGTGDPAEAGIEEATA